MPLHSASNQTFAILVDHSDRSRPFTSVTTPPPYKRIRCWTSAFKLSTPSSGSSGISNGSKRRRRYFCHYQQMRINSVSSGSVWIINRNTSEYETGVMRDVSLHSWGGAIHTDTISVVIYSRGTQTTEKLAKLRRCTQRLSRGGSATLSCPLKARAATERRRKENNC